MAESSGSVVSNNINIVKQLSFVQSLESVEENKTDKVMEPILLEDTRYGEEPMTLKTMLDFLENTKPNASRIDILVGLIFILMLESGFVPIEDKEGIDHYNFNYQRVLKLSKRLPTGWNKDIRTISFVLPPFLIFECKTTFIVAADDLLMNCTVKGIQCGYFNVCLDPLMYFLCSKSDLKNVSLQHLNHLAKLVKESVCYPAKQAILRKNNIYSSCLEELPVEIIYLIVSYLRIEDFVHFCSVNSYFYEFLKTPSIWNKYLLRDFNYICSKQRNIDELRNIYKKYYICKFGARR